MKFNYPDGATPLDDISGLKISWVKTQGDLNQVEAENIFHAASRYLLQEVPQVSSWFNLSKLKEIHQTMFSDVWDWAGQFRKVQTIPGIPAYQIPQALNELCNDVNFWHEEENDLTLLEQSARVHHRLVFIHPFPNGNGRFSRLVADRLLKAHNISFPQWPVDIDSNGRNRTAYIQSLKTADKGDYSSLLEFMIKHGAQQ